MKNLIRFTEMVKSCKFVGFLRFNFSSTIYKNFGKTDNMSKYETSFLVNVYLLMLTLLTIIYQ